ncbi:MAG: hypothetical protein M3Z09_12980, partial [Acidobacteriota bacterium]|nr:hypothetical protein [Acidobacteriota bacterium]
MNRINQNRKQLSSIASHTAPLLAGALACFLLGSGNLIAASICYGGSEIKNSSGAIVGCAFNNWGTGEQAMCKGSTVFSGSNSNNCHICVQSPYDQQVSNSDFTGLTLTPNPYPGETPAPPTTFSCLKCAQPPDGLTAWWTLDETNGTVHDLTGNLPNDGLNHGGAAAVLGEVGNAA